MIKNPDIISEVATFENRPTLVVGFAAETENLLDNASAKLLRKNLDLICANDVGSLTTGFASDQNKILLLMRLSEEHIESEQLPLASKKDLSKQIVNIIAQRYNQKKSK